MYRSVLAWDKRLAKRWRRNQVSPWLRRPLLFAVLMGDGWGWVFLALVLALALPARQFLELLGQGFTTAVISLPLYWGLKSFFRRTRPHLLSKRIVPLVSPRDLYSFPSGHTMNNLAIGLSLAAHVPVLWPLVVIIPVSVGLLRVLFGVHYILDVVAGALFGFLVGWIAVMVYTFPRVG